MGTKNNPGDFDCYSNAEPDEPMFILLGRDRMAPSLVSLWADVREEHGEDAAKVQEARQCADAMRAWLERLGKPERFVIEGDVYGQARAWADVFYLCKSLGMNVLSDVRLTGREKVLGFIRDLAMQRSAISEDD